MGVLGGTWSLVNINLKGMTRLNSICEGCVGKRVGERSSSISPVMG